MGVPLLVVTCHSTRLLATSEQHQTMMMLEEAENSERVVVPCSTKPPTSCPNKPLRSPAILNSTPMDFPTKVQQKRSKNALQKQKRSLTQRKPRCEIVDRRMARSEGTGRVGGPFSRRCHDLPQRLSAIFG